MSYSSLGLSRFAAWAIPVALFGQASMLDRLVGQEPLPKDDQERLDKLLGPSPGLFGMPLMAWHVWRTINPSPARYVVLQVESLISIPGGSSACVHLFDGAAKRMARWCFPVGWRITPSRASFEFSQDLASDLIILEMSRSVNGRNIRKEFYSLSQDRLRLVRLEDDQGKAIHNAYTLPTYEVGVVPAARAVNEFVAMLESPDKAQVLEALGFLGARHFDDFPGTPNKQPSVHAEFVQKLSDSERIRALVRRLEQSRHPWIREAASLANRPLNARPIF